jgi:hypothetical protein
MNESWSSSPIAFSAHTTPCALFSLLFPTDTDTNLLPSRKEGGIAIATIWMKNRRIYLST